MVVAVGDPFPNILLSLRGQEVHLHDRLADQQAIVIGCTGAFSKHSGALVEGYKFLSPLLRATGKIAFIGCLAVNDPFVLKAWAKKLRISDEIVFISDANGTLTKSLGLQVTEQVQKSYGGHSKRCRNFVAILAPGGLVSHLYVDDYTVAPCNELCRLFNVRLTPDQENQLRLIMEGGEVVKLTGDEKLTWPLVVPGLSSLPFVSPKSLIVKDLSRPSVRLDYGLAEELRRWILRRSALDGICRLYPGSTPEGEPLSTPLSGGEFGTLLLDSDRSELFDEQTGARLANVETPRKSSELEYEAQFIVIDTNNVLPLSHSASIGTLAIVHKRVAAREGSDLYAILGIPLLPGGRDNFIASVHAWTCAHRADAPGVPADQNFVVEEFPDEPAGVNLNKYVHSYMKLYRYSAPSVYTADDASATWLICEEPCYVDSQHLNSVRSVGRRSQSLLYSASQGFLVTAE